MGEDGDDEPTLVRHYKNNIYFTGEVNNVSMQELFICLEKVANKHDQIILCINSEGGYVHDGFAGMDYIQTIIKRGKVVDTIVYGFCASAATILLLAGSKKKMGPNAQILIHQLSVDIGGTYDALKNEMKTNKKVMKSLRKVYTENTDIPPDILESLLLKDVTLSAKKCLDYGIVDEIL